MYYAKLMDKDSVKVDLWLDSAYHTWSFKVYLLLGEKVEHCVDLP